jgi:hypothetical protein
MANEDDLPLPIEIPWRLASTTQLLNAGDPDQTTISLFTFQPDDEDLLSDFPGQKIVLLKVTVSISPASFPPGTVPPIASALGEGIPCYHVLLDLKVRKEDGQLGTDRPYFHAAAPLRRQMLQTGVIGTDLFEGAADSQFVGRSGSQVHEITSSHTRTSSRAGGVSLLGIGVSARTTTTDVTGTRDVTQVTDTTTREASRERRELVSHMTKVENILTLLNAKYVGTPYLSFSLAPQPLQQLSADSTDPSLWFSQLLQRRSSGIEGVQEFTAVILVPDGEDFCVEARLRRVCVLDDPPGPPNFQEPFSLAAPKLGRLLNYLFDTYPIGTPVEELDVDLLQGLPQPELFPRPAVEMWVIAPAGAMLADILSPRPQVLGQMSRATVSYKTFIELWLETLRAEYERDLMRSPLERGVLVGEDRTLDTCFSFAEGNLLKVLKTSTNVSPLSVLPFRVGELDVGVPQATTTTAARRGVKAQALETVTRWNALEQRLATVLANNRSRFRAEPGKFNDPRVVGVLIDRWAKLAADDPLNLDFNAAANALKLSDVHRRALKSAGATDLQSMARALKAAQVIERYNQHLAQRPREARADRTALATPIEFPLPAKLAAEIVKAIGDTVFGGEAKPPITRRRR